MKKILIIIVLGILGVTTYAQGDYLERDEVSRHHEFIKRTTMLTVKVATEIAGEDTTGMGVNKATKRQDLAAVVFADQDGEGANFAKTIAAAGSIAVTVEADTLNYTGGSTLDNDIEFTIESVWDDRAGVFTNE